MLLSERLNKLRLKCQKLRESNSLLSNANSEECLNKLAVVMQAHNEMKNLQSSVRQKYNEATINETRLLAKIKKASNELKNLSQENRKLENYLSKTKAKKSSKAVENIKGVNDYLGIVDKKNVSTICQLNNKVKENDSQISFNKPPLLLDLNDHFMGFDSMTTMYTDPSHEFCSNLYYKIQKESAVIEDTVQTLISIMQKEILSIKTSIKDLDKFISRTIQEATETKKQSIRIFQNDQNSTIELIKKRRVLEELKLNNISYLNTLKSDIEFLDNCTEVKQTPIRGTCVKYSQWFLKKLSVEQLYDIWSQMNTQWSYDFEKTNA